MKKLLLITLVVSNHFLYSKHYSYDRKRELVGYTATFLNSYSLESSLFSCNQSDLTVSFPYSLNGGPSQIQIFSHHFSNGMLAPMYVFPFPLECAKDNVYLQIPLKLGLDGKSSDFGFNFGYRTTLTRKKFNVRFGVGVHMASVDNLVIGSFDNNNKSITIDQHVFGPSFIHTHHSRHGSYKETVHSDLLNVEYNQDVVYINPTIGIEYQAPDKSYLATLSCSYNIVTSTNTYLEFEQFGKKDFFGSRTESDYEKWAPVSHSFVDFRFSGAQNPIDFNRFSVNLNFVFTMK